MRRWPATDRSERTEADRLFHHDRLIVWNLLRATFAGWHDRAIAALTLVAASAVIRAWFTDRPWMTAAWVALGAGTMTGLSIGHLLAARLRFQASDGLLTADALHPRTRRRYQVCWHGVGLAQLAAVTLIARPSLLLVSLPAYLAGTLAATLTTRLRSSWRNAGTARKGWAIREWSHRPLAGVCAATLLFLSVLPPHALDMDALMAMIGAEALLFALMLTSVDHAIIRFMTMAGHGSGSIILRHSRGLASFLAVTVPACLGMAGPIPAGILAAVGLAVSLLPTLRILAYRARDKRLADFIVSVSTGLFLVVAYSLPVALPLIVLAVLWHLQHRASARTWLMP